MEEIVKKELQAGNKEAVVHIHNGIMSYAKSLQLCLILCNPTDCSLPGSSVHGIIQARILECVAMPSSNSSLLFTSKTN